MPAAITDLPDIRVLSIRQPWADLILSGAKTVENRTWPTRWRGVLVVHAGRSIDRTGQQVATTMGAQVDPTPPTGYLGVVELTDVHRERDQCCGQWAQFDVVHWRVARPHRFPHPIPGPGQRGLYRPPAAVLAAVADLLALDNTSHQRDHVPA